MKPRQTRQRQRVITGVKTVVFGKPAFARLPGKQFGEALVARRREVVDLAKAADDVEAKRDQRVMIAQPPSFISERKPARAAPEKFQRFIRLHSDELVSLSAGKERKCTRTEGALVREIIVA